MVPRAVLVGGLEVEAWQDELHEGVEEEDVALDTATTGHGQEVAGMMAARDSWPFADAPLPAACTITHATCHLTCV